MSLIKKTLIHKLSVGEIGVKELGFWKAIGLVLLYQILVDIFWIVPSLIEISIYGYKINTWTWFGTIIKDIIITAIVITIIIKKKKIEDNSSSHHLINMGISKKDYIYCAGLIFSFIMIKYGLLSEMFNRLPYLIPDELIEGMEAMIANANLLILFIQVVIIAPIFEEIFYRGIVFNGMLKRYSPKKAIIVSSIIFGLVHLNLPQGLNAFLIGIIIATVYYYTKSLYIAMFMHAANNFLVFFVYVPENLVLKIALYIIIPILGIVLILKCKNKLDLKNRFNTCIIEEEYDLIIECE